MKTMIDKNEKSCHNSLKKSRIVFSPKLSYFPQRFK